MSEVIKRLNSDAWVTLLIRVPVTIFSFLYSIFLIRMLGPEGNGLYSFLMASIGFSILIFSFDANKSTLYHIVRREFETERVLGFSYLIFGISSLVVGMILLVLYFFKNPASYFFIPEEHFTAFYILFFLGSFLCQHFTALFTTIIQGHKSFKNFNLLIFVSSLLQVIFYGIGFYLVTRVIERDYEVLFLYIMAVQFIILIIAWVLFRRTFRGKVVKPTADLKSSYLKYARLSYANNIGHFLNKRVDVWFVELFSGLKSLGVYALSTQLSNFLLLFSAPVEEVLNPYLIGMEREEGNRVFKNYFRLIFYLIVVLGLLLYIISPFLISIFFGEDFIGAVIPLKILAIGVIFVNVKRMFINYNKAFNDLKINIWAQWAGVAMTIILDLILIPDYGIVGAAWASLFAYMLTALILATYVILKQGFKLQDLIILKSKDIHLLKKMITRYVPSRK